MNVDINVPLNFVQYNFIDSPEDINLLYRNQIHSNYKQYESILKKKLININIYSTDLSKKKCNYILY